jgi:hypothetical protein
VSIPFTFENLTGQELYLESCPPVLPPILERRYDDEWETAWTPLTYVCSPHPIVVAPHAVYADTLRVHAHPFGGGRRPQFRDQEVTGTYRLLLTNVWTSWTREQRPFGRELTARLRFSNAFQLRAPSK